MFYFDNIISYHSQLLQQECSCVEAVNFYLSNIKKNKTLNAFIEVYDKEAIEKALLLDQEIKEKKTLRKLHGVVISIKDNLLFKNHLVSASSNILKNFVACETATAVSRLIDQGAIIIGRTNCDEFAMGCSNENSCYGHVKNHLDDRRIPGGSSGGAAVSLQFNGCMVALGSDTGGSVRMPADLCGLIGMKPSYGRISRYGLIAYASSLDQIGIFSKNIIDASIVLECMAGVDILDSTSSSLPVPSYYHYITKEKIQPYRIAYLTDTLAFSDIDKEIAVTIQQYLQQLTHHSFHLNAVDFPLLQYIVPTYYVISTAEASSNLSKYDGVKYGNRDTNHSSLSTMYTSTRSNGFGKEVKKRMMLGNYVLSSGYYEAYFTKAQQVRQLLFEQYNKIFETNDFIISPTVTETACYFNTKKTGNASYLSDIFTVFANLVGAPAISIPLFTHSNGLPFGLQIIAQPFKEDKLLQLSHYLMNLNK